MLDYRGIGEVALPTSWQVTPCSPFQPIFVPLLEKPHSWGVLRVKPRSPAVTFTGCSWEAGPRKQLGGAVKGVSES